MDITRLYKPTRALCAIAKIYLTFMWQRLIKYAYKRWVNELYVPPYQTFAIGYKNNALGVTWQSMLPDTLVLRVKDKAGKWQDAILER